MNSFTKGAGIMNLRQLEFFITLAKLEHMTKAAQALNTTQPNLSHSMKELEAELEIPLFERVGRNIKLTKYGEFFLPYAQASLTALNDGRQALGELISPTHGHLSLGLIYTTGYSIAPPLLKKFKNLPQNKNITFSLQQGTTEKIINALLLDEIDLALCSHINHPAVDFTPLFKQELVLIVPNDHVLATESEVSVKQITHYPFINFSKGSGLRPVIDKLFENMTPPKAVFEITEDHSIAGFVENGFGISIVPNIKSLSAFDLNIIKIKDMPFDRYIYLAKLKDKYLSPVTLKFVDFITNYMENEF
jgi:DNA-binding transcriptional LysR family regulator